MEHDARTHNHKSEPKTDSDADLLAQRSTSQMQTSALAMRMLWHFEASLNLSSALRNLHSTITVIATVFEQAQHEACGLPHTVALCQPRRMALHPALATAPNAHRIRSSDEAPTLFTFARMHRHASSHSGTTCSTLRNLARATHPLLIPSLHPDAQLRDLAHRHHLLHSARRRAAAPVIQI